MTISVSDCVAQYLAQKQVPFVYELVGGMITQLLDSIHRRGETRIVSMHHEQAAAFAAEATGRMTGIPGVALATSGPGAVNLLTGVGSCFFDSSPAVFLTGQVNRAEMRGERPIRQLGFQETDIVAMARPITKAAWCVHNPEEVPALLDRAFALATSGRPGPVLIDLPMDVQRALIASPAAVGLDARTSLKDVELGELFADLLRAQRPLILAGGGVRASRTTSEFLAFVERLGVPVVQSLMGLDVMAASHPLRAGLIGTYGNRWANIALAESDFLLVLGSRLDVRQTGADTVSFKTGKVIYHVDVDAGEINNRIVGCQAICSDLADFFTAAKKALPARLPQWAEWKGRIAETRSKWPDAAEQNGTPGINPNLTMQRISAACPDAAAFVVDVGQHQMWAAQSVMLKEGQRFLTSGGMGSMGFALPAAIGAAFATGKPVVVIAGDGGLQCNIQEFQTVVRNKLPVRIVVIDNGSLGMVRQFQESYFDGRYQSTIWGYSAPDFAQVAQAYGIPAKQVEAPDALEAAAQWLGNESGPALLHVKVSVTANAYPKIAFGRPISDMEPFAQPIAMEST